MAQTMQQIMIQNPYQTPGQSTYTGFNNNNLSFEPTVEELNRTASFGGQISIKESGCSEIADEPLFGAHIREAAGTVRKLFGR
jgi:hypothetical protein